MDSILFRDCALPHWRRDGAAVGEVPLSCVSCSFSLFRVVGSDAPLRVAAHKRSSIDRVRASTASEQEQRGQVVVEQVPVPVLYDHPVERPRGDT